MRTKFAALMIAALLASSSSASYAQDADKTFQGPFVGVGVGGLNDGIQGDDVFDNQDQWSAAFTGFVGYDHKLPYNFVVGVEAGAVYSADDEQIFDGGAGARNLDPQYEINATGRIGYLVRPDVLVYARGGYSHFEADFEQIGGPGVYLSENFDGWLVGGGVEYLFYKNLSARAEYRYLDLNQDGLDLERNQAFVGVSYRF